MAVDRKTPIEEGSRGHFEYNSSDTGAIMRLKQICKRFPGVLALDEVNLELYRGEVHILVGANGAGKSTLVKILAGVYQPDGGTIELDGKLVSFKDPHTAKRLGIAVVHQHFSLIGNLDVAQNVFLNREVICGKIIKRLNWKKMYTETKSILTNLGLQNIDPKEKVESLSIADQQMIEIVKALSIKSKILIFDEPTSSLSDHETDELFRRIKQLKEQGVSIIYISHRIEDFKRIGDRVSVLKDGRRVGSGSIEEMNLEQITKLMLGKNVKDIYTWSARSYGDELLRVDHISSIKGGFRDISFSLREGEILGIGGVVGAKRTELVHAIIGALPLNSGTLYYREKPLEIRGPKDAVKHGIGVLHEDKAKHGMFTTMSVGKNMTSSRLDKLKGRWGLRLRYENQVANSFRQKLNIRTTSVDAKISLLSGGNQQKVMISKLMFASCEIWILDEPTKGIDIGAKQEIYNLIQSLADEGKGIILISSELPEIVGMCDRVLVMKAGQISDEILREDLSEQRILGSAL